MLRRTFMFAFTAVCLAVVSSFAVRAQEPDLLVLSFILDQRQEVPTARWLGQVSDLKNPVGVMWHQLDMPLPSNPDHCDGIYLVRAEINNFGNDRPGYHVLVGTEVLASGYVRAFWMLDDSKQAAHAGPVYNPTHLAVSYVDSPRKSPPTEAQLKTMMAITRFWMEKHGIGSSAVVGHKEVHSNRSDPVGVNMEKIRRELKELEPKSLLISSQRTEFFNPIEGGKWVNPFGGSIGYTTRWAGEGSQYRHNGWDIIARIGQPVRAAAPGQVVHIGPMHVLGPGTGQGDQVVVIDHGGGHYSSYGHNQKAIVEKGQFVSAGEQIALAGSEGFSSNPHVHFEVIEGGEFSGDWRNPWLRGRNIDPKKWMEGETEFNLLRLPIGGQVKVLSLPGLPKGVHHTQIPRYLITGIKPSELIAIGALLALIVFLFWLFGPLAVLAAAAKIVGMVLKAFFSFWRAYSAAKKKKLFKLAFLFLDIFLVFSLISFLAFISVLHEKGLLKPLLETAIMSVSPRRINLRAISSGFISGEGGGGQYAVVWGVPGRQIGTLGLTNTPEEIILAGLEWQEEIRKKTNKDLLFVVVPRLSRVFDIEDAARLTTLVKSNHAGMVIPDAYGSLENAYKYADKLTPYGIDGVALDLEFTGGVTFSQLRRFGEHLAEVRKQHGLEEDGIVLIWHVFDWTISADDLGLDVPGVKFVVIHDGYGSTQAKARGVEKVQQIYQLPPSQTGWMAFDRRWPINRTNAPPGIRTGFDSQPWTDLIKVGVMSEAGWWAQQ